MRLCKRVSHSWLVLLVLLVFVAGCAGTRDDEGIAGTIESPDTGIVGVEPPEPNLVEPAIPVVENDLPDANESRSELKVEELTVSAGRRIDDATTGQASNEAARRPVDVLARVRKQAAPESLAAASVAQDASQYHAPHHPSVWPHPLPPAVDRENYEHLVQNPLRLVSEQPVSTFSIDVDTGAYSNMRRFLNNGSLPPQDAVRIEELINYFSYDYATPDNVDRPFSVSTVATRAPWNTDRILLRIGIKGYEVPREERARANLVFLADVSGSMNSPDKLPLLANALKLLTRQLSSEDRVSLVVYAGSSGVVLEPTAGNRHRVIAGALNRLRAGGSTNGASGIRLAYQLAQEAFIDGGVNRVILATDGDFNVGTVNFEALIDLVERERENGVSLTTLGFGTGNYNDHLMERLADAGNGNHAYIDTLKEARKVLVDQMSGTLQTIAKDVKIQVEFNPAMVSEYRLIGYENRMLRREDFNNDKIDAGEIGAGHTVTALYELALAGSEDRLIDPLRYQRDERRISKRKASGELAFVRMRYKAPDGDRSKLIEQAVRSKDIVKLGRADADFRFAAAVAAFGQLLKGGQYTGDYSYDDIARLAAESRSDDRFGYRGEFLGLVRLADSLTGTDPERRASR